MLSGRGESTPPSFSRLAVEAGPALRSTDGYPCLELRALAATALLLAAGGIGLDPGAELGLRLSMGNGSSRGFIDLTGALWPVYLRPPSSGSALSPLEIFASAGFLLGGS